MTEQVIHYYRTPGLSKNSTDILLSTLKTKIPTLKFCEVETEICFNVGSKNHLPEEAEKQLLWLLASCFEEKNLSRQSRFNSAPGAYLAEFGPRLNFATPFSTNAVSICQNIGLTQVSRIEISRRYFFKIEATSNDVNLNDLLMKIFSLLYDKMTETCYKQPLQSFSINVNPEPVFEIDIIKNGKAALEKANCELGLALDAWDIEFYSVLFRDKLLRNPTNVECFDLAQSNSEHSRHWFFKGKMIIDGVEKEEALFQLVCNTQNNTNPNNVIKFSDNSSAIKGFQVSTLIPQNPTTASSYVIKEKMRHILLTAETHNFPTGVAPFSGATTGTGGRIRDTHATGTGSHVIAGVAGYCFGSLNIPGYDLPWEKELDYPSNFASPLEIIIEASNGASDYGNKFGEPVICGFARSFGMVMPNSERREWIKPIMFSAGIGAIDDEHLSKKTPEIGMKVLKIGGPIYRIGVGGGAASSIQVQGDNAQELDFGAVQRGDAEMEQKLNRLIRACLEMDGMNPICSIHDQGAGGNGNVLKEISEPAGAIIYAGQFQLGDPTLSLLEIWGAEYQESDAILIEAKDSELLKKIGEREKVPVSFVGEITGTGNIVLEDEKFEKESGDQTEQHAVNLPLDCVLGKMPSKVYHLSRVNETLHPLELPQKLSVLDMLERVLRLPSVASKRYLTNKVDRSVTGLIAQQQCVGPLQTPLADVGVIALSHFDIAGGATAVGEQPIKMIVDPKKGARLTVAEAFTNLVFAKISDVKDVKCSANWMWPAKLPGEGPRLYDACTAMCDFLSSLGAAVDGGKDSLSMAARMKKEIVKAPGALVVTVYAPCTDIRKTITPDLKQSGNSLIYINLSGDNHFQLGGTALAQVFNQVGNDVADITDTSVFTRSFNVIQSLLSNGLVVSGHDVSDGGLITTVLEMCFAGNLGVRINLDQIKVHKDDSNITNLLFNENPAVVIEVSPDNYTDVIKSISDAQLQYFPIGRVTESRFVHVSHKDEALLNVELHYLRSAWEETSFQLDELQCNPLCVKSEKETLNLRHQPPYHVSFDVSTTLPVSCVRKVKVAILREEGSNGDREMSSCLYMAGFDVYDVTMQDLCKGNMTLDSFKGLIFVGGFSYADVFGSAKGWAALIKYNASVRQELERFHSRKDTFSLGVCNGCQLMALLGWIGSSNVNDKMEQNICFTHNVSERFESRFVNVKLEKSSSIMLKGMEDSLLGIWVAHGEGRVKEKHNGVLQQLIHNNLSPIRYVDDDGAITEQYPFNPNGSYQGIAAICSEDGRHLAMMPHPERCFMTWQLPFAPDSLKNSKTSPWLQMFVNAYLWSVNK